MVFTGGYVEFALMHDIHSSDPSGRNRGSALQRSPFLQTSATVSDSLVLCQAMNSYECKTHVRYIYIRFEKLAKRYSCWIRPTSGTLISTYESVDKSDTLVHQIFWSSTR